MPMQPRPIAETAGPVVPSFLVSIRSGCPRSARSLKRRCGVCSQPIVVADLRSLTVLAAVVRHRSFTQAARELHVAQQAVSRTVARLEAELGVSLMERTTHRVEPTAAGTALAEDAESLVAAADAAVARARELGGAPPQTLALGMSPGISQGEVAADPRRGGRRAAGPAARPRRVPPRGRRPPAARRARRPRARALRAAGARPSRAAAGRDAGRAGGPARPSLRAPPHARDAGRPGGRARC